MKILEMRNYGKRENTNLGYNIDNVLIMLFVWFI